MMKRLALCGTVTLLARWALLAQLAPFCCTPPLPPFTPMTNTDGTQPTFRADADVDAFKQHVINHRAVANQEDVCTFTASSHQQE